MNRLLSKLTRKRAGQTAELSPLEELQRRLPDASEPELNIIQRVQACTMTSPERLTGLMRAVQHIRKHQIEGAVVECGVWRGGSIMAIALQLLSRLSSVDHDRTGIDPRHLWLFDTFEGMTPPDQRDIDWSGNLATELLHDSDDPSAADSVWCLSHLETVRENVASTGYPADYIHYVEGPVEKTLQSAETGPIALLRLDTDWYESTHCELQHLFPRLVSGGILIVDDYGHWQGCRRAVDEYFSKHDIRIFLNRMDYTGRMGVKP
jgi:hypothetical protein